ELLERLERGGMLPRKRFLASAADIDFAQLAVERRGDQVEVPTEVAERLHAEKLPARTPQVWVDRVTTHSFWVEPMVPRSTRLPHKRFLGAAHEPSSGSTVDGGFERLA